MTQLYHNLSRKVKLERSDNQLFLDINNLTVIFSANDKEDIEFKNIGFAKVYLVCHIIVHLSLHEYFINNERPVPRFLFFDQPSQVFFPNIQEESVSNHVQKLTNEQISDLTEIYRFIIENVESIKNQFQIIITDQADLKDTTITKYKNKNLSSIEKLIPSNW